MTPGKVHLVAAPGPVVIATIAILVLALVATLVLSRVIKRREAARAAAAALRARPAIRAERVQRALSSNGPRDVQERLRFLTVSIDRALGNAPLNGSGQGTAAAGERPDPATPRAGTAGPDDATRYFGDASDLTAHEDPGAQASTRRGDLGDGATTFFGPEPQIGVDGDATRFFADPDAADFFGEEPRPATAPGERDDATRFFDVEDDGHPPLLSSETPFFSAGVSANRGEAFSGTSSLAAPLLSQAGFAGSALDRVRERLAAVATPEVLALSVLDGNGRVLAGDTDDDLTGELRSLMAEAGQGNAADLEQPVRLGDDSTGALLLLPTGANALLGALVYDADDPQATRARLRGLAHEIGDAMRRAS
jgi:type II secretory pathway pseudopilin PulG